MKRPAFSISETKAQIGWAVTLKLISAFVFLGYYNPSSTLSRIFKPLAIFCICTARFVSGLVGNPEDRFSHVPAKLYIFSGGFRFLRHFTKNFQPSHK